MGPQSSFLTLLFLAGLAPLSAQTSAQTNHIDNISTVFQRLSVVAPKSEFETGAQYAARTKPGLPSKEYVFTYRNNWVQNSGPGDRSHYNAENGALSFEDSTQTMSMTNLSDLSEIAQRINDPAIHFLSLSYTGHEEGKYLGKNSFGATTPVTRIIAYNAGIIISPEDSEWLCILIDLGDNCSSHFELRMPADEAKLLKPFLQLAYVGQITDTQVRRGDEWHHATFSNPVEFMEHQQAVRFHITEVRVIDIRNGKVYATFNNPGPGAPSQSIP